MTTKMLMALAALGLGAIAAPAAAKDMGGVACTTPPPLSCDGEACVPMLTDLGNATEPKSGRKFFLDYPCDLKPGEKVVFILNIHGAGSVGNWQRHYFPAKDYKEKYRLVVATGTAATMASMGGSGPGVRMWMPAADDAYLQGITDYVFQTFGRQNIKAMWLAGHSQGGFTSRRIVCSDYFRDKVDGWLSLSGGRIGQAPFVKTFGPPKPDGSPPDPRPASATSAMMGDTPPACEFSHIFEVGQHEVEALPTTSPWAEKYGCGPRVRRKDIVDTQPGHVWDYARAGYKVWGMKARPGTAEEYVYPKCAGGRVVADVMRMDKGHTEGLEPHVTEELVKLMVSAPGGKAAGK